METINGTGTRLYGQREVAADGSYIATRWVVFLFLPVLPLGSFRVLRGESQARFLGSSTSYQMTRVPWHWRQIMLTYLPTLFLGPFFGLLLLWALTLLALSLLGSS